MFADSDATRLLGKAGVAAPAALRPPAVPMRQPKFGTHRSKSIDQCSAFEPMGSPSSRPSGQTTTAAAALLLSSVSVRKKPPPVLRHSLTFHGAEQLQHGATSSDGGGGGGSGRNTPDNYRKSVRHGSYEPPGSGAATTVGHTAAEKVILEHQLRSYSEQLKSITESVRLYSEQAKLLSDMRSHRAADKQQQLQQLLHLNGDSASQLARSKKPPSSLPVDSVYSAAHNHHHHSDVITPSHQLRVFLDNIRSNVQDMPGARTCTPIDEAQQAPVVAATPLTAAANGKTPSDQLHSFLDEIRSNYLHDDSDSGSLRTTRTTAAATHGGSTRNGGGTALQPPPLAGDMHQQQLDAMSEQFSPITENCNRPPEQPLYAAAHHRPGSGSTASGVVDMNQHKLNSILHACRRQSGHIHTNDAIMFLRSCIEDGARRVHQPALVERRWRDDVQQLLQRPQFDSFSVLLNRINLFVDAVNMQALMSEVKPIANGAVDKITFG